MTRRSWGTLARKAGTVEVAAIMIVAVIGGFFVGLGRAQEAARRTSCLNNLRQIELSLIQYAGEYDDEYPLFLKQKEEPAQDRFERLLTLGYLNAPKVFHCPSAAFKERPDTKKLNGRALPNVAFNDKEVGVVAKVYLDVDWCSYGIDPRVKHTDGAGRAVVADKPHHDYYGYGVSSPEAGKPGSNSENHGGLGQNIAYNDGHVKWHRNCRDDSLIDPNVYAENKEINVDDDSNIDFGTKAIRPGEKK